MQVDVGGNPATKVTRQDGSVDINGVQVTPPTGQMGPEQIIAAAIEANNQPQALS